MAIKLMHVLSMINNASRTVHATSKASIMLIISGQSATIYGNRPQKSISASIDDPDSSVGVV